MSSVVPAEDLPQSTSSVVPNEDLPESSPVPAEDLPGNTSQYETPAQQAITVAEGLGKGWAGPIATAAELGLSKLGVPGISAEEQQSRAEANPIESHAAEAAGLGIGAITGTGEIGLLSKSLKGLEAAKTASIWAKIGTSALKSAIEMSIVQGGDELSQSMLGRTSSASAIAGRMAEAGALGLIGGGVFGTIGAGLGKGSEALEAADNGKLSKNAKSFLTGIGATAKEIAPEETAIRTSPESPFHQDIFGGVKALDPIEEFKEDPDFSPKMFKMGQLVGKGILNAPTKAADLAVAASAGQGPLGDIVAGTVFDKYVGPYITKLVEKPISRTVRDVAANLIADGKTNNLATAIKYANKVVSGTKAINNGIKGIFNIGGQQALNLDISDSDRQKVKDYIDAGGVNQDIQEAKPNQTEAPIDQSETPQYAEGGEVKSKQLSPLAELFPEQNMALSAAKGRISNHLSGLKPLEHPMKLPYDSKPPTHEAEHRYNQAIDMAIKPLSVLKHIKDGTLSINHIQDLTAMYPELYQHLSKELTKQITHNQIEEERPSQRIKQSLGFFLATPLESHMTPDGIRAAQTAFIPKQMPQSPQPQAKTKKGTSTLGKSNKTYLTNNQAAEERQTTER